MKRHGIVYSGVIALAAGACAPAAAQSSSVSDAGASTNDSAAATISSQSALAAYRQSRDDAWWTGPILAASAGSLPPGHFLFEPYFFDVVTYGHYDSNGTVRSIPKQQYFGSQSYVLYGLTNRVSVGLIPRFGFNDPSGGSSSSHVGIGDLGLQGQYRLTQFQEGSWIPTSSIVLGETLPTAKYDQLGDRPADGLGGGAYTTTLSLYTQSFLWMRNGRILRTRLDLSYSISNRAAVRDLSVYGTGQGFRGHARPGNSFLADSAWEYSATRNWVLALDIYYERDADTRVTGLVAAQPASGFQSSLVDLSSGTSHSFGFAPAVEYNWTGAMGIIAGAKVSAAGRNASAQVVPVAAINMVF